MLVVTLVLVTELLIMVVVLVTVDGAKVFLMTGAEIEVVITGAVLVVVGDTLPFGAVRTANIFPWLVRM